jgi:hypothetical protein
MENYAVAAPLRCSITRIANWTLNRVAINDTFDVATEVVTAFNATMEANRIDTCDVAAWDRRKRRRYLWWLPSEAHAGGARQFAGGAIRPLLDSVLRDEVDDPDGVEDAVSSAAAVAAFNAEAQAWVARMLSDANGTNATSGAGGFTVVLGIVVPPDPTVPDITGPNNGRGIGVIEAMQNVSRLIIARLEAARTSGNLTQELAPFVYAYAQATGLNVTVLMQSISMLAPFAIMPSMRPPSPSPSPPPPPPVLTAEETLAVSIATPLACLIISVLSFEAYRRRWRRLQREKRRKLEKQRHGEDGAEAGREGTLRRAGSVLSGSRVHVEVGVGPDSVDDDALDALKVARGGTFRRSQQHLELDGADGSLSPAMAAAEAREAAAVAAAMAADAPPAFVPGASVGIPARVLPGLHLPPLPLAARDTEFTSTVRRDDGGGERVTLSRRGGATTPGTPRRGWATPSRAAAATPAATGDDDIIDFSLAGAATGGNGNLVSVLRDLDAAVLRLGRSAGAALDADAPAAIFAAADSRRPSFVPPASIRRQVTSRSGLRSVASPVPGDRRDGFTPAPSVPATPARPPHAAGDGGGDASTVGSGGMHGGVSVTAPSRGGVVVSLGSRGSRGRDGGGDEAGFAGANPMHPTRAAAPPDAPSGASSRRGSVAVSLPPHVRGGSRGMLPLPSPAVRRPSAHVAAPVAAAPPASAAPLSAVRSSAAPRLPGLIATPAPVLSARPSLAAGAADGGAASPMAPPPAGAAAAAAAAAAPSPATAAHLSGLGVYRAGVLRRHPAGSLGARTPLSRAPLSRVPSAADLSDED